MLLLVVPPSSQTSEPGQLTALEDFETHNHNLTAAYTDGMVLFSSNGGSSCISTPEVTVGPYNVHGELIRSNITETQEGVPVHLEFQFVDCSTCEGVENMMLDVWAANATGVYSGVEITGNEGGLENTYLRGLQATDSDGVASFDTTFPGHYAGRAIHQHVMSHYNYTILSNNTIVGGDITKGLLLWISIGIDPTANYTSETFSAGSWDGTTTLPVTNDLEGL